MVSSVTILVLLLLVSLAAVQAQQVLNNFNMDGCGGSSGLLTDWTGTAFCGPSSDQPCSLSSMAFVSGGPTPGLSDCAAQWAPGVSAYSQNVVLTPGSYNFQAFLGCFDFGGVGECTFTLTIDSTPITLSGATKNAVDSGATYTPVTATGIPITNPAVTVSLDCALTSGSSYCLVTQATLTRQAVVVGDPHFVGLDGQIFDMTGEAGSAYSLLSDKDVMVCVFPLSYLLSPSFSAICWIKRHTQ